MNTRFILIGLLALIVSCKKDKEETGSDEKSATQLLTQKEWVLNAHGFDDNKNGVLDPEENVIKDCQRDNSYVFKTDGNGSSFDNAMRCEGPEKTDFAWKLLNNDSKLEISFEKLSILRLNENDLALSPDIEWLTVQYILVYKH